MHVAREHENDDRPSLHRLLEALALRPSRPAAISRSLHDLVVDGLGRLERWSTCAALLPALDSVHVVDYSRVAHAHHARVMLLDGRRTLLDVIEHPEHAGLETLLALVELEREGALMADDELDVAQATEDAERWLDDTGERLATVRRRRMARRVIVALAIVCTSAAVTIALRHHPEPSPIARAVHHAPVQARVAPVIRTMPTPAQELARPDPVALVRESKALLERGALKRALALAQRAVDVAPEAADAYLVIGTIEQQRGGDSAARRAYTRYLALAPRGESATDVRAILKSIR